MTCYTAGFSVGIRRRGRVEDVRWFVRQVRFCKFIWTNRSADVISELGSKCTNMPHV